MKTNLIALVALSIASYPALLADVAEGAPFEAPTDLAEQLLGEKKARLADPAPSQKTVKSVKARVLATCDLGVVNDVVELPADLAKQAERDGLVDTDKAAVTYAGSLEQNQPKPKART
ncbi:MAG: hypothetical protein DCF26_09440 [Burkholderiales bacterium]|nr:MAG: hypothetical protein DCF26_09440 [Burkholderiales bacterium]